MTRDEMERDLFRAILIEPARGGGYLVSDNERDRLIRKVRGRRAALSAARAYMDAENWRPRIYFVADNDRVSLLSPDGRTLQQWR